MLLARADRRPEDMRELIVAPTFGGGITFRVPSENPGVFDNAQCLCKHPLLVGEGDFELLAIILFLVWPPFSSEKLDCYQLEPPC